MIIKKWNPTGGPNSTGAWEAAYPLVDVDSIVATGEPGSTTFLRGDGAWASVDSGNQFVNISGDTMTGELNLPSYVINTDFYHTWTRKYTVSTTTPATLLYKDGNALPNGGVYRFTAHIAVTGTDNMAQAVFWNANGTWKVNVTGQSGTSSNHPEFIVSGGVPKLTTDHSSNYTISVFSERMELEEGAGTDNAQFAFGAGSYLSSVGGVLRYNSGGGSDYTAGSTVWHSGNDGSGSGLDADTLDTYHETSFLRISANSSSPTNGHFAIGNASSRNFIQSHNSHPLDINPLGNNVTLNSGGGNVGIGTTNPTGKLDVRQGYFFALITGADVNASTLTNNSRKYTRIGMPHYTNAQEPVSLITGDSDGTNNLVYIGGGTSAGNAATQIHLKTSSNATTTIGTTRLFVGSNGNVGIGTTSPETKLKVLDTVNYASPTLGTNSGNFSVIKTDSAADQVGDYGLLMGISGSGWSWLQAQRVDGTATAYALNLQPSGGNVGIGTTSPSQKLEVSGNIRATSSLLAGANLYLNDDNTATDTSIYFGDAASDTAHRLFFDDSDQHFRFSDSLTTSGNVRSTGWMWASGNLHTNGNLYLNYDNTAGNSYVFFGDAGSDAEHYLQFSDATQKFTLTDDLIVTGDVTVNGSFTMVDTNTQTTEQWNVTNDGTGPAVTINQTGAQPIMDVQDDGTSVFKIIDGGNVGIGTSSPSEKLEVDGAGIFDGNASGRVLYLRGNGNIIQFQGASNQNVWEVVGREDNFYIYNNDLSKRSIYIDDGTNRIGINNNTSPAVELDVFGEIRGYVSSTTNASKLWSENGSTGQASLELKNSEGHFRTITSGGAYYVYDQTDGAHRFYIDTSGDFGIGTTTPSEKLDVNGTFKAGGFNGTDTDQWPNFYWLRGVTGWDEGLIKGSSSRGVFGKAHFGIHFDDDRSFAFHTSGWDTEMEINGDGTLYMKGPVGIGTSSPEYKLDVEGDFRVKATYDFVIRQLEISSSSYDRRVITLVPKHTSNAGATRAVYGEFTLGKKGGNIFDPFKLGVQSVYNNTRGFIQENGTNKVGHKFVEFDYNSVRWIGVELAYEANPYNYCMFYGTAETDTASGDQLKVLSYYDENGGGVLNSEIYNSLADFTVSNSTDTIYYNGHEVWHDGNDGIGSGLHADLLDGQHGSYYAPLASPTFTGIPTAPTTATSDNSTKIATTAYVKSNISDLIGGAPDALNTLNELAAALADDENYAATITTALGTKVAKSGGNTISGNQNFYGNDTSGVYSSAPIEIREVNLVTTNQSSSAYAPGLAFHWGGRVQTQIKLHSDGNLNLSGNQTGRILTTADEGSGNGLDADTLDTYHASAFYLASNPNGYTSNAGTVTNVTGGTGVDVTNGTTTPSITLDLSEFTSMTDDINGLADELILLDGGAERRKTISSIKLSQFNNDSGWQSRRPVTAGGNSLASFESLDFIAGTGITISESGGDVTISASSSGEPEWEYVTKVSGANPLTYSGMDALSNYEYKFVVEVVTTAEDNSNPYIRINNDSTTGETSYQYTRVQQTTLTGETETHNGNANSNLIYTGLALSSYSNGGTSVSTVHNAEFIYTISPYSSSPGIYTGIVDGWGSTHYSSQSGTAYDGMVQSRFTGRKRSIYQTEANRIDYYHDITAGTTDYSEMRVYRRPKK